MKAVAGGMKLREDAAASLTKIKEDAEDIRFDEKESFNCVVSLPTVLLVS